MVNETRAAVRSSSALERRLAAEWALLVALSKRNPERLVDLWADDLQFGVTLRQTPALRIASHSATEKEAVETEHRLRIDFPRCFPAAPMELFLDEPMQHPNIHPETGFVCLWQRHSTSYTVEHAVLKAAAILGWRLSNAQAVHVMQPQALAHLRVSGETVAQTLWAPALLGVQPQGSLPGQEHSGARRQRLS